MLVLTRKPEESICIGEDIEVFVLRVSGNRVRIGVDAPESVRILRNELKEDGDDKKKAKLKKVA